MALDVRLKMAFGAVALSMTIGMAAPAAAETLSLHPVPPQTVAQMAEWAVRSGDNQDMPFVVVDKQSALVAVFDADGRLLGSEAALIGSAIGDDSVPGIGDRELNQIRPEERTTPAGRFIGYYGPAADRSEEVLWVDFETAVSLHPVVTGNPREKRLERLSSPSADDNRITFGCINVSEDFYRNVVRGQFQGRKGVFYILPETRSLTEVFPDFRVMQAKAPARKSRFRWMAG